MYTNTIDGGFAINRFEVLADLQAPVSTLLNVCFPGECRQNAFSFACHTIFLGQNIGEGSTKFPTLFKAFT